ITHQVQIILDRSYHLFLIPFSLSHISVSATSSYFLFTASPPPQPYTLSLHDALPILSHRDNCLHSVNPSTKVHFWTIQNLCVLLSNRNVATLQLCLVHGGTSYQPRRTPMGLFVTSLTRPYCLIMYVTHH